ncbi:MAG: hypothetical protein KIS92_20455 [Planctomycetota bacterium]|nr:hypothetical protein [Planctomycetota bacterium]
MDDNQRKVLEMVAAGKVSVADAERLLEKLHKAAPAAKGDPEAGADEDEAAPGAKPKGKAPKFLRVVVQDVFGDNVNVRVPLTLVKTGVRLSALLPREAREAVEDKGVDLNGLSGLDGEDLVSALAELELNAQEVDGSSVRIFCE